MPRELRGWQPDPYGIHELRYFTADGKPSRLVRDGEGWSNDEPPRDIFHLTGLPLAPTPAQASRHYPADSYQDPGNPGHLRYGNGIGWTERTHPASPPSGSAV